MRGRTINQKRIAKDMINPKNLKITIKNRKRIKNRKYPFINSPTVF